MVSLMYGVIFACLRFSLSTYLDMIAVIFRCDATAPGAISWQKLVQSAEASHAFLIRIQLVSKPSTTGADWEWLIEQYAVFKRVVLVATIDRLIQDGYIGSDRSQYGLDADSGGIKEGVRRSEAVGLYCIGLDKSDPTAASPAPPPQSCGLDLQLSP